MIGTGQFFANWDQRTAVVMATRAARTHQVARLQNPIDRGKGGVEQALFPSCDGQDPMGQIHILLTLGHGRNALNFLRQQPMQRFLGTGGAIRQTQTLALVRLPAHDPAMGDRQNRATAPGGNALVLGSGNHDKDGLFGRRRQPGVGYRSHEPPFVFFRRMASSTACSARARSFSSRSALSFS